MRKIVPLQVKNYDNFTILFDTCGVNVANPREIPHSHAPMYYSLFSTNCIELKEIN